LIAVIAVGIDPILEDGPWHPLNSLVAFVVLVTLIAYAIMPLKNSSSRSREERASVGAVVGLIAAVVLAWPLQYLAGLVNGGVNSEVIDLATWASLGLGAIITICVMRWLNRARPKAIPYAESG
jgi:hypothetical protein